MLMHFVDSLAMFARRNAEEKFKQGNIKGAITCATMAKTLDPKVDGIDETILAYKIHRAAIKNMAMVQQIGTKFLALGKALRTTLRTSRCNATNW